MFITFLLHGVHYDKHRILKDVEDTEIAFKELILVTNSSLSLTVFFALETKLCFVLGEDCLDFSFKAAFIFLYQVISSPHVDYHWTQCILKLILSFSPPIIIVLTHSDTHLLVGSSDRH